MQGLMSGEALLGSLPSEWQAILLFDENSGSGSGSYEPAFRNDETGDIHYRDPRVQPISLPVSSVVIDGREYFVEQREEPSMLTSELLKHRGVGIRSFDFV